MLGFSPLASAPLADDGVVIVVIVTASGEGILPRIEASGAAERIATAEGTALLQPIAAAGQAERVVRGTGDFTLGNVLGYGVAVRIYVATGSAVLPTIGARGRELPPSGRRFAYPGEEPTNAVVLVVRGENEVVLETRSLNDVRVITNREAA